MDWNKNNGQKKKSKGLIYRSVLCRFFALCLFLFTLFLTFCSVSYKFEGGSVNYNYTKTIKITAFPNRTPYYPQLSQVLDLALRKRFIEQTRLKEVTNNGDIEMEGEITNFDVKGMAVKDDAYSSRTRLTITVHLQYTNNKEAGKNVDKTFFAFQEFDNTSSLDEVQDGLIKTIVDELVDEIYNATIASW
jgi:hypothetical protein